jgi:pyrimidine-nucleoside phosphorylase
LTAKKRGYLSEMNAQSMGEILIDLGGGRKQTTDKVNPSVGLLFHKKLGAQIKAGEPLVTLLIDKTQIGKNPKIVNELETSFFNSVAITPSRKPVKKLVLEVMK